MLNLFIRKKITGFSTSFLLAVAVALTGCGGGGAGTTGTGTGTGTTTAAPGITVALTNGGVTVTSISSGAPATVTATVRDTAGSPVPSAVVTFSTDATLATITPVSATALTDAAGVATVTLNPVSLVAAGAATITANSQVGTTAVTGSKGYSVGAAAVNITNPAFGVSPLSAFGTTSIAVTVSSNGVPVTAPQSVNFTSPCASSGKAVLTPSVATVNGVATASYRDNGCAGTDTVTASVSGIISSSSTLSVTAPSTGSIQFISATPTSISLRGMGGAGRQEASQVIFKAVDTAGNPIGGKTVNFSLSTAVGGITLTTASAISDPTTGQVVVGVNSGAVSTPVRVLASTVSGATTLTTQSDQLTITTGIPDQQNFSLSATTLNIEGWNYDGTTTVLTARLADHFNNPVPDGTAVNFTAEGGSIVSSCTTTAGTCSATLTSQALRPTDGRVTVLAYAVGEEGFTDLNGNGMADNPTEMKDANGASTDMGEAYVDYNENGVRDSATEPFIDFNGNNAYDSPDGQYNGVLCDANAAPGSSATACSLKKGIHTRTSNVIVFSGSNAVITINAGATISLPVCNAATGVTPLTFVVNVVDLHCNAMPAGTTVAFSTSSNGTITSSASYTVPNTNGKGNCAGAGFSPPGSGGFGDIPVTMKSDATWTPADPTTVPPTAAKCADITHNGTFTVTVTTPKGVVTTSTMAVID